MTSRPTVASQRKLEALAQQLATEVDGWRKENDNIRKEISTLHAQLRRAEVLIDREIGDGAFRLYVIKGTP